MTPFSQVSIVTPSLNQGKFIRATIDSVLSQNYQNVEYWVIDGGSTDDTLEILRSYGSRLHWISEPDAGQADAVNKGWQRAYGEILGWVNADDLLLPGAIERVVNFLAKSPHCGALYGDCTYVNARGEEVGFYPVRSYDYETLLVQAENFIPQPATFVRRRVAEEAGWLDANLQYVMDFDFWLRLGIKEKICYLSEPFAALRIYNESKTGARIAHFAPELEQVYSRIFAMVQLPSLLRAQEKEAWAQLYLRAASYSFWGGEPRLARSYLKKSWKAMPLWRRRSFWLLGLFSALGMRGYHLAERWHGNPFDFDGAHV